MSSWRAARSLIVLREQINQMFPKRSKSADGLIGDANHATTKSDHNPWVKQGDMGIVTGMDITHDPLNGLDSEHLAEALRTGRDSRLKYVISNRKIASFDHKDFLWRPYDGKNAHNHHVHISVRPDVALYDKLADWFLDHVKPPSVPPAGMEYTAPKPLLVLGNKGADVRELQAKLSIVVDGDFGPKTREAVIEFQRAHGLTPDGKVGPYTWERLRA